MSKISFFSQSNVFNFSEVYFYNYPFSKLFLYKEPWFLKEIATPLRGITTFFGTCATLRKKSFGKNLRITIKVHEKKKMIIWILSQNSIVEHFWTEFIFFKIYFFWEIVIARNRNCQWRFRSKLVEILLKTYLAEINATKLFYIH